MKEFFNKLCNNISSLFRNGGPHWSSTRFAFLFSVIISNFVIFGTWIGLSIKAGELLPIDASIIILYCIANGVSSATKLVQKQMEHKEIKPIKTVKTNVKESAA